MSGLLFLLVLASIPIQLGKFFFLQHSYVLGLPIDYRAITLYFFDLAILLFLISAIWQNRKNLAKIAKTFKLYCLALSALITYLFLSALLFSTSREASLIFSVRILILGLFSILAANELADKKLQQKSLLVLAFSVIWQSILVVAQFINQGSVGFKILGERAFNASTVAIAKSSLFGYQFLRPYGTFPHPNVAAAYLSISAIILASSKRAVPALIATFAVVLTFSKSALATLAMGILLSVKSLQNVIIFLILTLGIGIFIAAQTTSYQIETVAERLLLSQAALDIALKNPLFGIGSNNFILELSKLNLYSLSQTRLLQPVHNVFLLVLSENGIIGLALFAVFLLTAAKHVKGKTKTAVFIALLIYLSVDHFLWTLPQGQLMFFSLMTYFLAGSKKAI